jgi:hypothetical protein
VGGGHSYEVWACLFLSSSFTLLLEERNGEGASSSLILGRLLSSARRAR